jgi:hypothetical protein
MFMFECRALQTWLLWIFTGGFYINTGSLPPGSEWVRYISMVYWGFQVSLVCVQQQ